MGKYEFFPYQVAIFEAKKAGNIGTFHLARALKEVKYPQPQNENSCSSCPRQGPQRTYRLHLFCQLQDNLGVLSLTRLSYPVINLLTYLAICKMLCKKENAMEPLVEKKQKDCLLRR